MPVLLAYVADLALLFGFGMFVHGVGRLTSYRSAAIPPIAVVTAVTGFLLGAVVPAGMSGVWSLDVIPVGLIVGAIFTAIAVPAVRLMFIRERAKRAERAEGGKPSSYDPPIG